MLYTGVVEDRFDPLKLGRTKVRVVGIHTHDKVKLPTADLPWAYPMQPVISGAMSGIGYTPLGPVEGTWVVVMFRDDDLQYPIVIGSIGGIPQPKQNDIYADDGTMVVQVNDQVVKTNAQANVVTDGSGNPVLDGSGRPVETQPQTETTTVENSNQLKRASEFNPSAKCLELIRQFEGFRNVAYQDSVAIWTIGYGIWTIGYGTTRVNGQPVQPGMTCTRAQADEWMLADLTEKMAPVIKRNVRAPITQSMFDAMCSFAYNVGPGAFANSTLLKDLNAGRYEDAAAGFLQWNKAGGQVLAGLTRRRNAEKNLFLAEGIPNIAGELPPQEEPTAQSQQGANNTTGTAGQRGTTRSNVSTSVSQPMGSALGFLDPNGKYPLYTREPDTNRLARHEQIQKTIVYKKEVARETGVETARSVTWDQPPIPYNAKYPYNHVMQSESGHTMEFDDTTNSERVHLYHRTGTFFEIDANGTRVTRIVGDDYEILERNGHIHINGSAHLTVDGASHILVRNSLNIDVHGVTNIRVFNDVNMEVSGNMNVAVRETFNLKADKVKIEGNSVDIKANGPMNINSTADMNILTDTTLYIDSAFTDMSNGAAPASPTGLADPAPRANPQMPEFSHLNVVTRGAGDSAHYETPEDGDPSAFIQRQINSGAVTAQEMTATPETKQEEKVPENNVQPIAPGCDAINNMNAFESSFKLSKNFTLGQLLNGRPLVAQQGLTIQQIVCNLKTLAENCLEPIKDMYPNFRLTSGFRIPGDTPNSSPTSDHYLGCAADFQVSGGRQEHFDAVKKIQQAIPFHQLILEYQGASTVWIHVAFRSSGNSKQSFTMNNHRRYGNMGEYILLA